MTGEPYPPIGTAAAAATRPAEPVKPAATGGQRGPTILARLEQLEQALAAAGNRITELERAVGT